MPNRNWHWRPKGAPASGLLYEPGNWGDILKDSWVWAVAAWLLRHYGLERFAYLDPLAGLPAYPLPPKTRQRLALVNLRDFSEALAEFLRHNLWPSAASIVASLMGETASGRIRVFDQHEERRAALAECQRFTVWDGQDGYDALISAAPDEHGLILVDPYDFLADWRKRLPQVMAAAEKTSLILYVYNRAVRGTEALRDYVDFRNEVEKNWASKPRLIGRAPSDAFCPPVTTRYFFSRALRCASIRNGKSWPRR
ncbi:MAG: hypothetical protein N3A66_05095 [Planctomycetota bacterium]|nr:hypothetical protein [Planctomycetota bacterium]